jgi:hypothetical protein
MSKYIGAVAPLLLGIAGGFIGGLFTAGAFSSVGLAVGLTLGNAFFGPKPPGPGPLEELRFPRVTAGGYRPDFYGRCQTTGTWIDAPDDGAVRIVKKTRKQLLTAAYGLGCGELIVDKIAAGKEVLFDRDNEAEPGYELTAELVGGKVVAELSDGLRLYRGSRKQPVDSALAALHGGFASAHRGEAYIVFKDLDLERFGNQIPSFMVWVRRVDAEGNVIDDVAQIITLHFMKAGLREEDISLTHLVGKTVYGCFENQGQPARVLSEQLARWHNCGLSQVGGTIVDYDRTDPQVWTIGADELGAYEWSGSDGGSGGSGSNADDATQTRGLLPRGKQDARQVPSHFYVKVVDPDLNFDIATAEHVWQTAPYYLPQTVDLQIVAREAEAVPRAGIWHDEMLLARDTASVSLPIGRLKVTPGDVLIVPIPDQPGQTFTFIVQEQNLSAAGVLTCSGSRWSAETYTRARTSPNWEARPIPTTPTHVVPGYVIADIVSRSDDTFDKNRIIVAATAPTASPWKGTQFISIGGSRAIPAGQAWSESLGSYVTLPDRATVGTLLEDFVLGDCERFDYDRAPLRLQSIWGDWLSADENEVRAGANLLLVGERLVSFVDALENPGSPGEFELSGLWDGRFGSDYTGTIPAGANVLLLTDIYGGDDSGWAMEPCYAWAKNKEKHFAFQNLGDLTKYVEGDFIYKANAWRALSPSPVTAKREGGITTLNVWARTRHEVNFWETGVSPVLSDGSNFVLELVHMSAVVHEATITGSAGKGTVTFSDADLNSYFGSLPASLTGRVWQENAHGAGFVREFSLPL